jgi:hypothetical protein
MHWSGEKVEAAQPVRNTRFAGATRVAAGWAERW